MFITFFVLIMLGILVRWGIAGFLMYSLSLATIGVITNWVFGETAMHWMLIICGICCLIGNPVESEPELRGITFWYDK